MHTWQGFLLTTTHKFGRMAGLHINIRYVCLYICMHARPSVCVYVPWVYHTHVFLYVHHWSIMLPAMLKRHKRWVNLTGRLIPKPTLLVPTYYPKWSVLTNTDYWQLFTLICSDLVVETISHGQPSFIEMNRNHESPIVANSWPIMLTILRINHECTPIISHIEPWLILKIEKRH